jgi:hypothetical protein
MVQTSFKNLQAKWSSLKTIDLPKLNAALRKMKAKPIEW